MNRGSTNRFLPAAFDVLASMRPRFMNRGSCGWRGSDLLPLGASMRPRFMNRGSVEDIKRLGEVYLELQ